MADKSVKYLIIVFFSRESTDKYLHKIKKKMANILSCFFFKKENKKFFFYPLRNSTSVFLSQFLYISFLFFFFAKPV